MFRNLWQFLRCLGKEKKIGVNLFFFYLIAPFYENFMVENCVEDIGDQRFGLSAY